MGRSSTLLNSDGPFANQLSGFAPRAEQQTLATAIEDILEKSGVLIGEAGTGVGKTFAYLVPAVLSEQRVLISTGTRHLQDQLFSKDLPLVCRALGFQPRIALLKGRANYLCNSRLHAAQQNPALRTPQLQQQLRAAENWAMRTRDGDISNCDTLAEDAVIWPYIVSQMDWCREHDADDQAGCFIHRARREAQAADIVVVNHHLLCADMAIKDEGFGEVLPNADAFIIDEAHHLPDTASHFFGQRLASRQWVELGRDIIGAQLSEAPEVVELRALAEKLDPGSKVLRLALGEATRRDAWYKVSKKPDVVDAVTHLQEQLQALQNLLADLSVRGKQLEACHRRCEEQVLLLQRFISEDSGEQIHWFETYRTGFALNLTPLEVASAFRRAIATLPAAWVFVSATLSVNGDFGHFRRQLGLPEDAAECQLDSPFDYKRNAALFVPTSLPAPQSAQYLDALLDAARPVIDAAGGRTFLLFTSHRALHLASERCRAELPYPIFVQGDRNKSDLIEAFRQSGNGVLLGTSSFWEGVDVRGEALSCVIIDRLPFASPGCPINEARIEAIRQSGGNAFYDYQLPQAIVSLKQGVGRLIRDPSDRGILLLGDPRLINKPYGRLFLHSLPPMRRTRRLDVVQHFFAGTLDDALASH